MTTKSEDSEMHIGSGASEEEICEYINGEFNEEVVVIRHDVDNIYGIYRPYRFPKIVKAINYGFLALLSITPSFRYIVPLYLEHIPVVLDIERQYGARASYFFRPITVPKGDIIRDLKKDGHELAYHSDRNKNYNEWLKDLKFIEKTLKVKVQGFTKHGYSIVRGGGIVPFDKLVEYASRAGLKYIGSSMNPRGTGPPHKYNGIWIFSHEITLKHTPWSKLKRYINSCTPLVLIHPEDLFIPGEMDKFEYILSRKRGISAIELINLLERLEFNESQRYS